MRERIVLHLTSMHSTKYGGLEKYFANLARLCRERGYRTILQYESPPQSPAYLCDLEKEGARVLPLMTQGSLVRAIVETAALLRSIRPEIVHSHFPSGFVLLALPALARLAGVRTLIATVHSPVDRGRAWHRRWAYNRHDHVLAVSDYVTRALLKRGVRRSILTTLYLGLFDPPTQCPESGRRLREEMGLPQETPAVSCIAHDHPSKGLDILLEACAQLGKIGRRVYLLIVGVDPERSRLPALARELGIDDRVRWVGIRDRGWELLRATDLYAQPSRSEGLPLAVMEAMALGLPVVASSVGGIPEAVLDGETGYLCAPGDPGSLHRALLRFLDDPPSIRRMGEAGRGRFQDRFSGERSIAMLTERYYGFR